MRSTACRGSSSNSSRRSRAASTRRRRLPLADHLDRAGASPGDALVLSRQRRRPATWPPRGRSRALTLAIPRSTPASASTRRRRAAAAPVALADPAADQDGKVRSPGSSPRRSASLPVEAQQEVIVEVPAPVPPQPQALPLSSFTRRRHRRHRQGGRMVVHPAAGHADGTRSTPAAPRRRSERRRGELRRASCIGWTRDVRPDGGGQHDAAHEALSSQSRAPRREGIPALVGACSPRARIEEPIGRDPTTGRRCRPRRGGPHRRVAITWRSRSRASACRRRHRDRPHARSACILRHRPPSSATRSTAASPPRPPQLRGVQKLARPFLHAAPVLRASGDGRTMGSVGAAADRPTWCAPAHDWAPGLLAGCPAEWTPSAARPESAPTRIWDAPQSTHRVARAAIDLFRRKSFSEGETEMHIAGWISVRCARRSSVSGGRSAAPRVSPRDRWQSSSTTRGAVVPGATVTAIHEPSGTSTGRHAGGRPLRHLGMRVGGPTR